MSSTAGQRRDFGDALGYLLKHVHLQFNEMSEQALAPLGLDPRELGALQVLAGGPPVSQQQAANVLGVDRTTMVALLDALEAKGVVSRHPDPQDRRRNVVELTEEGMQTFRRASAVYDRAERSFLEPLGARDAQHLRRYLHALVAAHVAGEPAGTGS